MGTRYASNTFERLNALADVVMKGLTLTELMCMVKQLSHGDFKTGTYGVTIKAFTEATGKDERTVRRALTRLKQRGLMPVVAHESGGRGNAPERTVKLPYVDRKEKTKRGASAPPVLTPETRASEPRVNGEQRGGVGAHVLEERGASDDTKGGMGVPERRASAPLPITHTYHTSLSSASAEAQPAAKDISLAPPKPRGKTRKPPTAGHQLLVDHFCRVWAERYPENEKYTFKGGRDGEHIKFILKAVPLLSDAKAVVDRYIACDEKFLVMKKHPLSMLVSEFERFKVADPDDLLGGQYFPTSEETDELLREMRGGK
jgi:hypothetical protein